MRSIGYDELLSEIGHSELRRLLLLQSWLRDRDGAVVPSNWEDDIKAMRVRTAPSIITRSEAELFGISLPRFAFRATMTGLDRASPIGFVNLRRIDSFQRAVGRRLQLDRNDEFLTQLRRRCRCIADALLEPPHWLTNRFDTIITRLNDAYDEPFPEAAVPFVTHFPVGGGMCAQAVSFQATALCHEAARAVFGVAEVTALASNNRDFLDFSGLSPRDLVRYFQHHHVGLNVIAQGIFSTAMTHANQQQVRLRYARALKAYVRSGYPVIVAVDMSKLQPVYQQLPSELRSALRVPGPAYHAVVVVGASPHSNEYRFVLNDPASFPFLVASIDELLGAMCEPRQLLPVTPSTVTVPLLDRKLRPPDVAEKLRVRCGLIGDIQTHRSGMCGIGSITHPSYDDIDRSEYILVRAESFSIRVPASNTTAHSDFLPADAISVLSDCTRQMRLPDGFYWAQHLCPATANESIWIWPASGTATAGSDSDTAWPVCVIVRNADGWRPAPLRMCQQQRLLFEDASVGEAHNDQESWLGIDGLKPALLSSFDVSGVVSARRNWPRTDDRAYPTELYVAMQSDVDGFRSQIGYTGEELNAVEAMASVSMPGFVLRELAALVHSQFPDTIALATFIPEISSEPNTERGREAQRALRFLAHFALLLHRHQRQDRKGGHSRESLRAIELVTGSRIGEIYRSLPFGPDLPRLVGRIRSDDEVQRNILENVRLALDEAAIPEQRPGQLSAKLHKYGIGLAFELEPGPLFVLRNQRTLQQFCERIRDLGGRITNDTHGGASHRMTSQLAAILGLNLDMAHWDLAQVNCEEVRRTESVFGRIIHGHVAGHHNRAHFGDTELHDHHLERYQKWFTLLKQRCELDSTGSSCLSYSGFVSLEYEAAGDVTKVTESLGRLSRRRET